MIASLEFNRFPQNSVEADSDFRDLQCQLFNNIISDSVLFNKDSKFIVVSSFSTNFSNTFTKLIVTSMFGRSNQSIPNDDFQLIVKLIVDSSSEGAQKSKFIVDSIPSYEGAQRAASKLIVICAFGLNKGINLISASCHQQLIVAYVNMNSKICLIFREECFRTFCEGEWELIGNISTVSFIELVELIGCFSHIIGLGGTIVIVDYNGLLDLLVSLAVALLASLTCWPCRTNGSLAFSVSLAILASFAASISSITMFFWPHWPRWPHRQLNWPRPRRLHWPQLRRPQRPQWHQRPHWPNQPHLMESLAH